MLIRPPLLFTAPGPRPEKVTSRAIVMPFAPAAVAPLTTKEPPE